MGAPFDDITNAPRRWNSLDAKVEREMWAKMHDNDFEYRMEVMAQFQRHRTELNKTIPVLPQTMMKLCDSLTRKEINGEAVYAKTVKLFIKAAYPDVEIIEEAPPQKYQRL